MASAYSTIANFGEKVDSYLIESIVDADGNVIYQHESTRTRVLDEALTAAVVRTLEKVPRAGGTAPAANIGRPQFGKTGTAQNFRDVWFVGGIPQYTTAVWVGHADAQIEMVDFYVYNERTDTDQYIRRAYGGTVAGPVWYDFMTYITEDLPVVEWPADPEGTDAFFRVPRTEVPDISGMTEDEAKDAVFKAGLRFNAEHVASIEPEDTFLEQSPSAGAEVNQGNIVTARYSSGIPPEMIDLHGLTLAEFEAAFTAFNEESGLNLTWTIENVPTDEPSVLGLIIGTNPPAGSLVLPDQNVIVYLGVPDPGGGEESED